MNLRLRNATTREIDFADPVEVFRRYADLDYSALLTGRGLRDISRYSFIGAFPHTILRYRPEGFEVEDEGGTVEISEPFWDLLKATLAETDFDAQAEPAGLCGGIGYLSYEALHAVERVEKRTQDNYAMPWLEWVFYNRYVVFDHHAGRAFEVDLDYERPSRIERRRDMGNGYRVADMAAECSPEVYREKVRRIQEYILEGDVYEVNLSQQIRGRFEGDPFALFERLYGINDAPFSAYLNFGPTRVVCNSPELFLRAEGRRVETRPIKGTAKRGATPEEDAANREALLASEKDQAELYMIVDLLRNDLGKVCEYGSVRVEAAKRLEAYRNVHHLVGIVSGRMRDGVDFFDLLRATFPGGSITGCPKVRCIEIIEELETFSRNLYTGTVFLMNRERFVSNIVIRTAVVTGGRIFMNSGGAVTIDSDPDAEYQETVHKLRSLMESIGYDHLL